MIRLLALVQKAPGIAPNQRFRIEQWSPHLRRDHGIAVEFSPFESPELTDVLYRPGNTARKIRACLADTARRWQERHRASAYDGVVVVREASIVGGAWLERELARRRIPFVYDFDDVIWQWTPSVRNGLMSLARVPWKVSTVCRLASAVTVGNEHLAEYARPWNRDVHVVRTSIDVDRYPAIPEPDHGVPFTLVWTGSHTTLAHLETIRPALERLGARMPLRLRVICDTEPPPFRNVATEFVPWRAATEAEDLAPAHVGLMPLPDTPLTRGKCGCKALQYMAIGRPAVVSPVGINREIVGHGRNGLWATSLDEWETQLAALAADGNFRRTLGAAARSTVLRGFTARASADAFAGVVRRIVRPGGRVDTPTLRDNA